MSPTCSSCAGSSRRARREIDLRIAAIDAEVDAEVEVTAEERRALVRSLTRAIEHAEGGDHDA